MSVFDRIKQKIWRFLYKIFPAWQYALLRSGVIHHGGRQRYHIGWLAPGRTLEELKHHLHDKWGFGNHFVAWGDEGQVLSWRKLTDFNHQYHLRVFSDGEIRGHFEYTPEGHPVAHFDEKGETFHEQEFIKFLGDFMTEEKHDMRLEMDPEAFNPHSEVTLESKA